MPSCVMRHCRNYTSKTSKSLGITYHAQRREEDWRPNTSSRICSVHFNIADKYTSKKGLTLLKKTAFPVLEEPSQCVSRSAGASPSIDHENISDLEAFLETPRKWHLKMYSKKKLIKNNKNLSKRNKRLEKKVRSMKNILKHLKKREYVSDEQFNELNVKPVVYNIFTRIVRQKKSKKGLRLKYPPAMRKFALTLNFYSPAAYKYVRQVFHTALPHPRVLSKWYENSSVLPGFTSQAFDTLKKKSELSGKRLL
ncbi:unnamed protein product [Arctia plantaginis]|uniref:THAP-type domain-containing protein n=1 Tax=Arctia plantaginis TaxID=874455 RepID=A0A8S0ZHE3_ARCPL|nr:unnamed protein product [Arctia plantaginis]